MGSMMAARKLLQSLLNIQYTVVEYEASLTADMAVKFSVFSKKSRGNWKATWKHFWFQEKPFF